MVLRSFLIFLTCFYFSIQLLENLTIIIDNDGNGRVDFEEFIDLIDKLETDEKNTKEGMVVYITKFKHSFYCSLVVIWV